MIILPRHYSVEIIIMTTVIIILLQVRYITKDQSKKKGLHTC